MNFKSRDFLSLPSVFAGAIIFTMFALANALVVFPSAERLDYEVAGNVELSFRGALGCVIFSVQWSSLVCMSAAFRVACLEQAKISSSSTVIGLHGDNIVKQDTLLTKVTLDVFLVKLLVSFTLKFFCFCWGAFFLAGMDVGSLVLVLMWSYAIFRVLPNAGRKWDPSGGSKRFMRVVRRVISIGVPLSIFPRLVFKPVLERWTPDVVTTLYPIFLSMVEYLLVNHILNDEVMNGFSEEGICIFARSSVALIESSRIGMLVVVANSPTGSFNGLIAATGLSVILHALARNNLFTVGGQALRRFLNWIWKSKIVSVCTTDEQQNTEAPVHAGFKNLPRFERILLGVKRDTEFWGVYMLVLIKWLGWAYGGSDAPALDHETGGLLPVLDCDWDVIIVVALGLLSSELLGSLLGLLIRKFAPPDLHIVTPVVVTSDFVLSVLMWMTVGLLYMNGIANMGVLSDSLLL